MDKRPKRRKYNDNPYELKEINNTYIVKFKDSKNIIKIVEVDLNVYKAFDRFELDDLSQLNEYDRHIEHIELDENSIYLKGGYQLPSTESIVEEKLQSEELYLAINSLSEIQKRRIKMYYFEDKSLKEIAEIKKCSIKNVFKSIELAKENLKKKLKK